MPYKMTHSAEFRRCLVDLDVAAIRRLWKHVQPNLPQPKSDLEALITLHMARTTTQSIPTKLRFYSHRWLLDNGYPSHLPDELKPKAERMYPRKVGVVGISANSKYPAIQQAIHGVMRNVALDAYADDPNPDPDALRKRMLEARAKEQKALGIKPK